MAFKVQHIETYIILRISTSEEMEEELVTTGHQGIDRELVSCLTLSSYYFKSDRTSTSTNIR